jgi:hypothetical protein
VHATEVSAAVSDWGGPNVVVAAAPARRTLVMPAAWLEAVRQLVVAAEANKLLC